MGRCPRPSPHKPGEKTNAETGASCGVACIPSVWCGWCACVLPVGHRAASIKEAILPVPSPRGSPPGGGPNSRGRGLDHWGWSWAEFARGELSYQGGGQGETPHPSPPGTPQEGQRWEASSKASDRRGERSQRRLDEREVLVPSLDPPPPKTPGPTSSWPHAPERDRGGQAVQGQASHQNGDMFTPESEQEALCFAHDIDKAQKREVPTDDSGGRNVELLVWFKQSSKLARGSQPARAAGGGQSRGLGTVLGTGPLHYSLTRDFGARMQAT